MRARGEGRAGWAGAAGGRACREGGGGEGRGWGDVPGGRRGGAGRGGGRAELALEC